MTVLVVEGQDDADLLRPVLSRERLDRVMVRIAGGRSSALSLGLSLASAGRGAVAVLVDGATTDELLLQEQATIFADLRRMTAAAGDCRLFLASPTLKDELLPRRGADVSDAGVKLSFSARGSVDGRRRTAGKVRAHGEHGGGVNGRGQDGASGRSLQDRPLIRDLILFLGAGERHGSVASRVGDAL